MMRKGMIVIGVLLVTAIVASAAVGYAVYNGNTYSENNTMQTATNRVDILVDDGTGYSFLDKTITLPEYVAGTEVITTEYVIATSGPGNVYVRCDMGDTKCWALIDSMSFHFNENITVEDDDAHIIPFGKIGNATGVPSAAIPMNDATQITLDGKTYYVYEFHIHVMFANYDVTSDEDFQKLTTFAGSKISFSFVPASS